MLYQELSSRIIGAVITVHKTLGPGLLEAPYHNALFFELSDAGLSVVYNTPYPVFYKGRQVGEYFADLTVAEKIILEIKSASSITAAHRAQIINYLRISGLCLGFIINFQGSKAVWERFIV